MKWRLSVEWVTVASASFLILVLVTVFGTRLSDAVSNLRAAPEDNVQWSLAQLEADLLRLSNATVLALESEDLDTVRKRFDVFYSRAGTISNARIFAELRDTETGRTALPEISAFLRGTEVLIDGPDEALREALPELAGRIADLERTVRSLSLTGVGLFARASDARRAEFQRLLLTATLVATGLILLLVFTLAVLYRQARVSTSRAEEISLSSERLSSTINASLDAIIVIDDQGLIIDMNTAAEQVFDYPRATAVGARMDEMIVPQRYLEAHRAGMERYRRTGEKHVVDKGRVELSARRADGTEFPVELSIGAASGKGGSIFIAYIRDISDRVAAETALKTARDNAMAADRAKSDFIAVMSHEMRTPLNGLLGVLDLLQKTGLKERQREYLDVAASSGEVLLRHVNDVLDIAKLEAGKVEIAYEPVDLGEIVAHVADVNRPAAEEHGVKIYANVQSPSRFLAGDAHRIRQILMNLVGNATKFTLSGTISIAVTVMAEDAEGADLEISVRDTGIGIAPQDQDHIFDDFMTVDPSYNRRFGGSGLGLAVCRRLVEAMDGTIAVDSVPGKGSDFTVRLRLPHIADGVSVRAAGGTGSASDDNWHKMKILLVEDNEINRFVAREMLRRGGHDIVEARDGREGIELADGALFDLILMDISMPGMDGVEATRSIRSGNGPNRDTPIVGLTAHALPEELKKFANAGMQNCLTKPIRIEILEEALAEVALSSRHAGTDPGSQAILDTDVLVELAEAISPSFFGETVRRACEEIESRAAELSRSGPKPDLATLAAKAHKLAGSAALVGAIALHGRLARIEAACKADDVEGAARDLEGLEILAAATTGQLIELLDDDDEAGQKPV